ncbi:saccharopine dehydrogenase [Rhodovulum sp. YNF3179]|uniref:saccharopine dehydrogenase n=1 Tax=Rhodovulum sp. YNF3179 TaxID=3425127 RepID=UPI003D3409A8
MTHLWVRAESRPSEQRVGLTPAGARALIARRFRVTVERSGTRAIGLAGYHDAGCEIAPEGSWPDAPGDAIVFGLKELPDDGTPLRHRHVMFGHAYKGQPDGPRLLARFRAGGGTLYDLEYLVDGAGRRVAAFGYWAGYAGAAVGLKVWAAQQAGTLQGPARIGVYDGRDSLLDDLRGDLVAGLSNGAEAPRVIVIGALGRVGTGAGDLAGALGLSVTRWDMAETAHGGPFPEILDHEIFVNCILARPGVPVFVPREAITAPRRLTVIADVSCDPGSAYNPVPVYDHATSFDDPVIRVTAGPPPLDVTAIDNLPSLLPVESSEDYAAQLLPSLERLDRIGAGVWGRAKAAFDEHSRDI